MSYRVFYTDAFRSDIAAHVAYLREQKVSGEVIERWYDRLFAQLDDLATWPKSYPVDERMTAELGLEARKFVYARHVVTYRIEDASQRVFLLRMIHGARRK